MGKVDDGVDPIAGEDGGMIAYGDKFPTAPDEDQFVKQARREPETLLERVDTELARAHLSLAASQRAALIVTLYQLFRETKRIDPDALARLVKLAQA